MRTTVVTAYYEIKSKRSHEQYLEWIRRFMAAEMAVVIYGDARSVQLLRAAYPEYATRLYRVKPIEQFITSGWSWDADFAMDREKRHSIELYKVWNEKLFLVREVIAANPFATDAFAWVDIGCVRDEQHLGSMAGFPDARRFDRNKISFLQVRPFAPADTRRLEKLDERFRKKVRVGGTIFAGGAAALLRAADIHHATIDEAMRLRVFAGKDQNLYAFEALRNPDLYELIESRPRAGFDHWFQLLWRWSAAPPAEPAPAPRRASLWERMRRCLAR